VGNQRKRSKEKGWLAAPAVKPFMPDQQMPSIVIAADVLF